MSSLSIPKSEKFGGNPKSLYTLYLPLNHNNGSRLDLTKLVGAERELITYAGGMTRHLPGQGFWINADGKLYQDKVLPIQVAVSPTPESLFWFTNWVAKVAITFEQEEIFIYAQPIWMLKDM